MTFHIITIFPKMFEGFLAHGVLAQAIKKGIIKVKVINLRDFAQGRHKTTDERPYGGGPGMVMKAEPILKAVKSIKTKKPKIIVFSPRGKMFTNKIADIYQKKHKDIILICGRYEGIDARVKKILKAEEVSIGNYVLSGGEVPAMALVDAVARRVPGVLHKLESIEEKRTASAEVYTRPEILKWGKKTYRTPKVLLTGHHGNIEEWRRKSRKRL
ncbi:MAG TPA: tRNA (guanosine(37)-N1)-methyltransferase TrmD [Candidatus Paceibacterota bacterium]|nr:tRNA (guanosine(37)-N1)-methyltransferase TrmD [Candidatus Paceibacterota bacterium]